MRAEGLEVSQGLTAEVGCWWLHHLHPSHLLGVVPNPCAVVQGKRCFPFSEPVDGEESKTHVWMKNRAFNFKFCQVTNIYLALCLSV